MYKPSITFDVSDDCLTIDGSTTSSKFFDMRVQMTSTTLVLDLWRANLTSALLCIPLSTKKYRFPLFLGNKHVIIERLTSNFAGRCARWSQIGMSHKQVLIAAIVDFGDLD